MSNPTYYLCLPNGGGFEEVVHLLGEGLKVWLDMLPVHLDNFPILLAGDATISIRKNCMKSVGPPLKMGGIGAQM